MRIKKKIWQYRRDFVAVYACEFCKNETEADGYDDNYFHNEVIPDWSCPNCGKSSGVATSSPIYPDGLQL